MKKEKEKTNSEVLANEETKQKTSEKVLDIIFKVAVLVFVVITILFYVSIVSLDLLPTSYIVIFTIVEIILTGLLAVGLGKKHKTRKLNIVCLSLALIFAGIYIVVANYANATNSFLDSVFTDVQETEDYYVVVNIESSYEEIYDIEEEEVYIFQIEDEDVKSGLQDIVNISFVSAEALVDLGNNLLESNINVIFISSTQYDMLSEEIEDFEENTRIIYTITDEIETTETISSEDSEYTISEGVFNVYISGIDTSGSISKVSRSDANMIVTVNTNTHEILLTSIPRDYYVTLHSKGAKDKLTHSGIYGINETVTTVEDFLDVDINYYVRVNFTTVIELVDILGGIEVESDYAFSSGGYSFVKGTNYLDGDAALVFSRERHAFSSGDNQRIKNQQAVLEAIIEKVTNSTTILTNYTSILNSLEGCFQTNINQSDISDLVKEQLNSMASWTVTTNSLTGTGTYGTTYSMGSTRLYIMIPNDDSISEATEKINALLQK